MTSISSVATNGAAPETEPEAADVVLTVPELIQTIPIGSVTADLISCETA
jgi:hypothetical protein